MKIFVAVLSGLIIFDAAMVFGVWVAALWRERLQRSGHGCSVIEARQLL